MENQRKTDSGSRTWFRSPSRISADRGLWYFEARGGELNGPYATRAQAESMLQNYLLVMRSQFADANFNLVEDADHPSLKRKLFDRNG